jgi:hypothetical protein
MVEIFPHIPITEASVTSSTINPNLNTIPQHPQHNPTQRKMGPVRKGPVKNGLCRRQILGAPPPERVPPCSHPPHGVPQKTFSKKGFCGAFSLKKRPPAPQRPPRPQAHTNIIQQKVKNVHDIIGKKYVFGQKMWYNGGKKSKGDGERCIGKMRRDF